MNNKITTLIFTTLLAFSLYAQEKVTVELDFGGKKDNETIEITWYEGMTALTALQSVATVETQSFQQHIIVVAINNIRSERGKMAWYYMVNNEVARELPSHNQINAGDTVRWIFIEDVCSRTVDEESER